MRNTIVFIMLLLSGFLCAQVNETTWFDSNWKQTFDKNLAVYYCICNLDTTDNHYLVEDHFSTGEIYRSGSFKSLNPEIRDGKFIWYFKNGRKNKEILYSENSVKSWTVWNEKKVVQLSVLLSFKGPHGEDLYEAFKVDKEPEFVGGVKAMKTFIDKNLVYPPSTKIDPIEGNVIVYVNVDTTGKLVDIKILRRLNPDVEKEALRVIQMMPDWKPGLIDGKPVKVPYIISIPFRNRSAQDFSRTRTSNPNY
jgi:periplasmic protein TonB